MGWGSTEPTIPDDRPLGPLPPPMAPDDYIVFADTPSPAWQAIQARSQEIDWAEAQDPANWSPRPAPTLVRILMIIVLTGFLFPIALFFPRTWWSIVKP